VLLKDGAEHRASRKLILPIFHHQAIASYFDTIQKVVTETVANWGTQGTISLETEMRKLTLSIAVRTFLGSEKTEEIDRVSQWYVTLVNTQFGMVKWDNPLTFYGRGQAARRKIADYIRQIIKDRIDLGDSDLSRDAMGLLMSIVDEDGNKFTETQIINQAIGFLFAAHETTSSLMSWLMFELGNRPEWRQKLRTEQQQVTGNEPLKLQHLRQLPQLSNVRKPLSMQKQLKATFMPLNPLLGAESAGTGVSPSRAPFQDRGARRAGWVDLRYTQITNQLGSID
jgi:retinoid hydroxylase